MKRKSKSALVKTIKVKSANRKKASKKIKIEAKPLTEEQIVEFVRHYNEHGSFPGSKIPCNMTGKLTTCVGPWMVKKIKEFGGAESLLRKYKCRGALKAKRQALKPAPKNKKRRQVLKELKDENKNWDLPKMNFLPPQPLTSPEITETTRTACLRPDIFLNNDRHCNGCEFFDVCGNSYKNLFDSSKIRRKLKK